MAKKQTNEDKNYKVVHMAYGGFPMGRVVHEDDLKAAGYSLERGLSTGALVATDEAPTQTPLQPNPHTVTNAALRKMAGQEGDQPEGEAGGAEGNEAETGDNSPVPPTNAELKRMSKDDLVKVAQERGIDKPEELSKKELLESLLSDDETVDDDADEDEDEK